MSDTASVNVCAGCGIPLTSSFVWGPDSKMRCHACASPSPTPKQAYERRRAEREAKLAASEKRYGRAPIFDPESNELFDMIDRFVTAVERIADTLEKRSH